MSASGVQAECNKGKGQPAEREFTPLAYLIHALNQPLTGLQCLLELAALGPRTSDQYLHAVREGLELTGRMRVLVGALREVAGIEQDPMAKTDGICLDGLLRDTVEELQPVAESRAIRIELGGIPLGPSYVSQGNMASAVFRLLDSALSLAADGTVLGIDLHSECRQAAINVDWTEPGVGTEGSPFSPQALGLLVAQAAWQRAGGQWETAASLATRRVILRLPWTATDNDSPTRTSGGCR